MGTVCLSNAPILRCQSLTRLESGILLIPSGLELIFSISLLFAKRSGRKHYCLSIEGIVYFILAGIDFLAHALPIPRHSLDIFKGLDIFIGALSFSPLLLYTLYLFLLTTQDVLPGFPRRMQAISKYVLIGFIPFIVVANELASFVGISYHLLQDPNGEHIIALGFMNDTVRLFLNSFVLVLLVCFQGLNFAASFFRLIKAFMNQRRIDTTVDGSDNEVHLFNGLGWIIGGIKLGAVESIIGFVQDGGFGLALTRRILRLLGRACLIIGVVKGVDIVEDFQFIKAPKEPKPQRRSMLRALISNPRHSTFQQIGGHNFSGASVADVVPAEIRATRLTPSTSVLIPPRAFMASSNLPRNPSALFSQAAMTPPRPPLMSTNMPPSMSSTDAPFSPQLPATAFAPEQRVTVYLTPHRAPTLVLRPVSDLDVPQSLKSDDPLSSRSASPARPVRPSTMSFPLTSPLSITEYVDETSPPIPLTAPADGSTDRKAARYTIAGGPDYSNTNRAARKSSLVLPRESVASIYSTDSLDVVHTLASQFPGIPPRRAASKSQSATLQSPQEGDEDDAMTVSGSASVSRSASERSQRTTTTRSGSLVRRSSSVKRKPVPKAKELTISEDGSDEITLVTNSAPVSRSNSLKDDNKAPMPPLPTAISVPDSAITFDAGRPLMDRRYTSPANVPFPSWQKTKNDQRATLEFPWVARTDNVAKDGVAVLEEARESVGISRIMSVGSAPRRTTRAVENAFARQSIIAEWYDLPDDLRKKKISETSAVSARHLGINRDLELGDSFLDCR
ncbi:unnamed protein product [Somion occarium]|uniref:Uncharacterized protein n=1 Tax=Somion occarium TaxID=3059160 RepID=A0ABP1DSE4_9APHY